MPKKPKNPKPPAPLYDDLALVSFPTSPESMKWTPKNELEIRLTREHIGTDKPQLVARLLEMSIRELAREAEVNITSQSTDEGGMVVTVAGKGAAKVARIIRDDAHIQFTGAASIPEGPAKGA